MITYPQFREGATIGVTAPSSGVAPDLHPLLEQAVSRMKAQGFQVVIGDTVRTQHKAKSAPAAVRAAEFNAMMRDERIALIMPPWGGELLIEMLPFVDFDAMPLKWVQGFSDLSVLLLAITLKTGMATAHGASLMDLRGEISDPTTAMWLSALKAKSGEAVVQHASSAFQKEWKDEPQSPCVYHLTEPTQWKTVSGAAESFRGRVLGGCIDVIRHLIGTPFGDVRHFQAHRIGGEPIVWYLENCELVTADMRRSLVQMKLAGWFENCSGILFGRSAANKPVDGYTAEDMYRELAEELQVPVVYDIDCGHVPPQITFVNGAYAEVEAGDGTGTIKQVYKP